MNSNVSFRMSKNAMSKFFLMTAFFFLFGGYYLGLVINANINTPLSLIIRIIIIFCLFSYMIINTYINSRSVLLIMAVFSILYLFKIGWQINSGVSGLTDNYMIGIYFITFSALPFFFISLSRINKNELELIVHAIQIGFILFFLVVILFYSEHMVTGSRLSNSISRDDNYISPLALSYCACCAASISLVYFLVIKKINKTTTVLMLSALALCIPSFILGASRGAVLGLLATFFFVIFFYGNLKRRVIIGGLCVLLFTLLLSSSFLDDFSFFQRFTNISHDIETGSSSAIRLYIWDLAISQFANSPILGGDIFVTGYGNYPHNIFVESFMSTGFIGGILFVMATLLVFRKVLIMIKRDNVYYYCLVIFVQAFIQFSFSGSIYTASWYFVAMALILALSNSLTTEKV